MNADVAGEPRWPMAGAVVVAMALTVVMPDRIRVGTPWILPLLEGVLLAALIAGDPGKIDRRSRLLRLLSIGLVSLLVLGALGATVRLTAQLVGGGPEVNSAFSPTDVMPLAPWAKIAMAVQSAISLAILGLVIARAVNLFA